jgi:hypothetical protein
LEGVRGEVTLKIPAENREFWSDRPENVVQKLMQLTLKMLSDKPKHP